MLQQDSQESPGGAAQPTILRDHEGPWSSKRQRGHNEGSDDDGTQPTFVATGRVDDGATGREATSRDDEGTTKVEAVTSAVHMADFDVCPRCGVFRAFAGMTDECCEKEFGMPCVFEQSMWIATVDEGTGDATGRDEDMIKDHDPAPAAAAVLTPKATSMAISAMPPVGTTMAAITMDLTAKDLCEVTDTDEGTQQGSAKPSGGRPRSRPPDGPTRWQLSLARAAEARAALCRQRPSGSMHQLGELSSEDVGGY